MLKNFFFDESGAAAAEYALILAIVGAGIAGAAFLLGGNVSKAMTKTAETVCAQQGTTAAC